MTSGNDRQARLKLRATDHDDLTIFSAHLQDALVPIADMVFLGDDRSFVLVANRFMWERAVGRGVEGDDDDNVDNTADGQRTFLRTNCGVRFSGVHAVRYRGFNLGDRRQVLSLLSIEPADDGILLHFAGGGDVYLDCDTVDCRMQDIDEPWPTQHRPHHLPEDDVSRAAEPPPDASASSRSAQS